MTDKRKAMTIRLDQAQADAIEAVARVSGRPVSEEIRAAILAHVEDRRKDKAFQARLRAFTERNRVLLDKLAGT